jgi:hypothetical protein
MTNHPRRTIVANARRVAEAAGYYIREGSYRVPSNRRGEIVYVFRWYFGNADFRFLHPEAYHTQGDAWIAAAEHAAEHLDTPRA